MLDSFIKIINLKDEFYYKDVIIDNQNLRIFNYRFVNDESFENPLACEMRGSVFNLDTGEFFPSMHKFFNDNENKYTIDKWSGVLEVREKLDGSLIIPVIVNNKVYFKTKATFDNDQSKMATSLLTNNLVTFIRDLHYSGYQPLFELISPNNRIVVPYNKTQLVLTQIRKLPDLSYLPYDIMYGVANGYKIPVVKVEYVDIEELNNRQEILENIEGWVAIKYDVTDIRKIFRKFKTAWYFRNHRILSYVGNSYKAIIEMILNEEIDDLLSVIDKIPEKKKEIEEIQKKFNNFYNKTISKLVKLFEIKETMTRKDFALKYSNYEYFSVIMRAKNIENSEELFKQLILKKCNREEKTREFIRKM